MHVTPSDVLSRNAPFHGRSFTTVSFAQVEALCGELSNDIQIAHIGKNAAERHHDEHSRRTKDDKWWSSVSAMNPIWFNSDGIFLSFQFMQKKKSKKSKKNFFFWNFCGFFCGND
jgi:hypothetical protein